jgi:hypothetical protein
MISNEWQTGALGTCGDSINETFYYFTEKTKNFTELQNPDCDIIYYVGIILGW